MELIHPKVDAYLTELIKEADPVFSEMEAKAVERAFPIVGRQAGRFLHLLVLATAARRILELGTGFGYSMLWMAKALGEQGEIIGVEGSEANARQARSYLSRAGVAARVQILTGDAVAVARTLKGPFDIVFNDVDKHQYPEIVDLAVPLLRTGGLLVTDNVLWHGRIFEPEPSPSTAGVIEYTRRVCSDPALLSTILPVRDGLAISVKVGR